jgi:flavin reductase (DIM6/NTAB) family NADH-FMN oxidoreductase RutF
MEHILTGAFVPFPAAPLVLVGAVVDGRPNYSAAAFTAGVNAKPPIVCVSLNRNHHTPRGILANGFFSLNFPSADDAAVADYCGLVSGKSVDKSALFTVFYGQTETAPMIAEFPLACECRYTGQKVEFEMDVLYFGEVMGVYARPDVLTPDHKFDTAAINPLLFTGLDNHYHALGADLGKAWSIGKDYRKVSRE